MTVKIAALALFDSMAGKGNYCKKNSQFKMLCQEDSGYKNSTTA